VRRPPGKFPGRDVALELPVLPLDPVVVIVLHLPLLALLALDGQEIPVRSRNGSHRSTDRPNGRQRSIAITDPLLLVLVESV
jgi:hypothetical protein